MKVSTVKLYKDSKIIEGRNFIVDDIESYLSTLTNTLEFTNFQYIKHGLNITIKVNKSQDYLDFKATNDYNYCSIVNVSSDGTSPQKKVYYFVDSMKWTAESTLSLNLVMDTINTFALGTDFTISDKTTILREHGDRYKKITGGDESYTTYSTSTYCTTYVTYDRYRSIVTIETDAGSIDSIDSWYSNANISTTITISGTNLVIEVEHENPNERIDIDVVCAIHTKVLYQRVIDPVSEGIQSLLFKTASTDILDNNNLRWYLVYKNKDNIDPDQINPTNPILAQLRPSETISVKEYSEVSIVASDLNNDQYILFTADYNSLPATSLDKSYSNIYSLTAKGYLASIRITKSFVKKVVEEVGTVSYGVIVYKTGGNLYTAQVTFTDAGSGYLNSSDLKGAIIIDNFKMDCNGLVASSLKGYKGSFANADDLKEWHSTSNYSNAISLSAATIINGIDMLDRTDSKLIKIIESPYCPSALEVRGNYFILGRGWTITTDGTESVIGLNDINIDLINEIKSNVESPIKELYRKELTISTTATRNDVNESKLFHSDFYQPKMVYDSFSYILQLENLDTDNPIFNKSVPDLFNVSWITANTINSRFLALFPQLEFRKSVQDFDNLMVVARNNELPIFNSTYLNYLRNGYNYDVKQKDAAIEKYKGDLWLNAISSISHVALGVGGGAIAGGGSPAGIAVGATSGVISGVTSFVQQYRNAAYNIARQEDSIALKLSQAAATAVSVSACDDVNLLKQYSPFIKYNKYQIGDNLKKAMADLFYYCGYKRDIQGTPNSTNRYWFNFVQANLVIATTNNIPSEIMNDIVSKYSEGITRLHHHTTWDFNQEKENWEVSLL